MFKIGDYVAHYKEGVCEVIDIGRLDISCSDKQKEYYTLKPLYNVKGTLYTPVENEKRQIRELISGQEAKKLIGEMGSIETIGVTDEKKREVFYKEALLKNQCREWVALLKTSYMRKMNRIASGKKSINVDEKYLSIEVFVRGTCLCVRYAKGRSTGVYREVFRRVTKEIIRSIHGTGLP